MNQIAYLTGHFETDASGHVKLSRLEITSEWPLTQIFNGKSADALFTSMGGDYYQQARNNLLTFVRTTPHYAWARPWLKNEKIA